MNALTRTLSVLALIACTVASSANAAVVRPFQGSQTSEFIYTGIHGQNNELVDFVAVGTGNYTHLGQTTFEIHGTLNVITGAGTGTSVYTAADGSQMFQEYTSQVIAQDVSVYQVVTIGGTGRLEGATGQYEGLGYITLRTESGGESMSSFTGWIEY